jgi:hypothetical protein
VTFSSSDPGATPVLPITFTGSEGGTATAAIVFATIGVQTLTAAQSTDASIAGTGSTRVHGLVYTDPATGLGKARLVLNALASNSRTVQLDLISNTTLVNSSSFGFGYGAAYAAGLSLPLEASRVALDAVPLVDSGSVLNPGTNPKAEIAALKDGVLYTGLSQKAAGSGASALDQSVIAGQRFYSVRLRLNPSASVGQVFDGTSALPARFRAAVRDHLGNDVITRSDFSIGRLEVR